MQKVELILPVNMSPYIFPRATLLKRQYEGFSYSYEQYSLRFHLPMDFFRVKKLSLNPQHFIIVPRRERSLEYSIFFTVFFNMFIVINDCVEWNAMTSTIEASVIHSFDKNHCWHSKSESSWKACLSTFFSLH